MISANKISLFVFFLVLINHGFTQNRTEKQDSFFAKLNPGYVEVVKDSRIDSLIKKEIMFNETKQNISGYRIQIYYGVQRVLANEKKAEFLKTYPATGAYLSYQQPNFRVRVGDYRTRWEALKFQKEIATVFKTAFIVKDNVTLPLLRVTER